MNSFLVLVLCVLYVQALKRRAPSVEDDVETSTFFDVPTNKPDYDVVGSRDVTDKKELAKLKEKFGDQIEAEYNEVYNKKDSNYSYLARIRFASSAVIQCKFFLTFSFKLSNLQS